MFSPAPTSSLISVCKTILPAPEPWAGTTWWPSHSKACSGRFSKRAYTASGMAGVTFSWTTGPLKDERSSVLPCPNCIIPLAQRTEIYLAVIEAPVAWASWRITDFNPLKNRLRLSPWCPLPRHPTSKTKVNHNKPPLLTASWVTNFPQLPLGVVQTLNIPEFRTEKLQGLFLTSFGCSLVSPS